MAPGSEGRSAPPAPSAVLGREALERDLREWAFRLGPVRCAAPAERVGVEVELLPVDGSGRPLPIEHPDRPCTTDVVRPWARAEGWAETPSPHGAPVFSGPRGGTLSFEPGGQLEVSSPPLSSVGGLLAWADGILGALRERAEDAGVRFLALGIDPLNPVESADLLLRGPRYRRMARHFDRYGVAGRRMMRQTAAIHVNLDLGDDPLRRWRVANRAAPVSVAVFANSRCYQGRDSGHRSFRAAQWRRLDPLRTGVRDRGGDPVAAYLDFALRADALLVGPEDQAPRPFARWLEEGVVTPTDWRAHLTTLFPEVRPRGYLEIRCVDALPPPWLAAPLVFWSGLLCDPAALREAEGLLPPPDPDALAGAGRLGLADPATARVADDLFEVALRGAERLGGRIGGAALERARAFHQTRTRRGLDPGDSLGGLPDD